MKQVRSALLAMALGLAAVAGIGCTQGGPAAGDQEAAGGDHGHDHDHDHGHRPQSYSAAIAQIKKARDEVKAAFDAGTPHACDDALHTLAEVLDVLPDVAAETDLPKEEWQSVKAHSKLLFDEFMKIHDGFHGGEKQGVPFDSVAAEIDAAIATLASKVAASGEPAVAEAHDHDHEHEHEHDEEQAHAHAEDQQP